MEYRGIFLGMVIMPTLFYVIVVFIVSVTLYCAIYQYIIQKLIEKLYFLTTHWDIIDRTQLYYLLITFPFIILGCFSLLYNQSLIGVEISYDIDEIQILLVSGYICWIQESRQTPLRGFLFLRDLLYLVGSICIFFEFYWKGQIKLMYGLISLGYYSIFYILQFFNNKVQDILLKILMLKESDSYNAKFLLTQKNEINNNILILGSIIQNNKQIIEESIKEYKCMLESSIQSEEDIRILINFSKIFLKIKNSYLIEKQNNAVLEQQNNQEEWSQGSIIFNQDSQKDSSEEQNESQLIIGHNDSAQGIIIQKSTNQNISDCVIETQEEFQKFQSQTLINKVIRYTCYPVYLFSLSDGRLRYLFQYISVGLLIGSIFLISNCVYYFSYLTNYNICLIGIIASLILVYPSSLYFVKISSENDFDFINIFIQSGILKITIFGIFISIASFTNPGFVQSGLQNLLILIIRIITYLIFCVYMVTKRYATRFTNFKFFVVLFSLSQLSRILIEIIYKEIKK